MTKPCATCSTEIDWATTVAGKKTPIVYSYKGRLAVRTDNGELRSRALTLTSPPLQPDERLANSHFATCRGPFTQKRRGSK